MSVEFTFTCPLPNGFHARPASHLAAVANQFNSDCALTNLRNGRVADVKSVLSMIAADIRLQDECSVRVQGPDEQRAGRALERFVETDLATCDMPLPDLFKGAGRRELPRALRLAGVQARFGLAAAPGIAQGRAAVIGERELLPEIAPRKALENPAGEERQIQRAMAAVRARMEKRLLENLSATEAGILRAHLAMLADPALVANMLEQVAQGRSAAQAVVAVRKIFADLLRRSENPYIRERAIDIEGLFMELLAKVSRKKLKFSVDLTEDSIVIAENMTPQQLLAMERKWLQGLVLESAGTTSHTVILAQSHLIPTLVGVKGVRSLRSGTEVVLDANRGFLIPELTPPVRTFYERELRTLGKRKSALRRYAMGLAYTSDGQAIGVAANVSSAEEAEAAFAAGANGIGVFRTEILFLARQHAPSEEEQFQIYSQVARVAKDKAVVIRTLDVGGDKPLPYLQMPADANPFLGYRGIRIYTEHLELLNTQLRAILRASARGRVDLLIPMVSTLEEVLWFKEQLAQAQKDLEKQQIPFQRSMNLGIMLEVPSAAFILDQLLPEVDFISIGTNDLSQYFFAADRGNPRVSGLAQVRHPGFLRFLQQIVVSARKYKKLITVCGDMAADPRNLPLLLGLGLDEISVPFSAIPVLKERIAKLCIPPCQKLLSEALACGQATNVDRLLDGEAGDTSQSLLNRDLILVGGEIANQADAIRAIIDAFYVDGRTDDPDRVEEAVWTRESVYSTGLGHGFAVPHCKTDAVNMASIGMLKLNKPVDWRSADSSPVEFVILLAARESDSASAHLRVFAQLARKLMDEAFRERLLKARDREEILSVLSKEFSPSVLSSSNRGPQE